MFYAQTLYLTADKRTVVVEGDPRAAFLLTRGGKEVRDGDMRSYGGAYGESILAQAKELSKAPSEDKSITPASKPSTPEPTPDEPTPIRRGRGRAKPETKEAAPPPVEDKGETVPAENTLTPEEIEARREELAKLDDEELAELIPEGFDGDRDALIETLATDPSILVAEDEGE